MGYTRLSHYFKNHCRPYCLVVGDVGTGLRGTSVMTIWWYPRYCHIVIAHGPRWPVLTSPTTSAILSIIHQDICGLCLLDTLVGHTQYINLPFLATFILSWLAILLRWLINITKKFWVPSARWGVLIVKNLDAYLERQPKNLEGSCKSHQSWRH